jgi:hypothetical protein
LPLCIVFCRFLNHTKSNRQETLLLTLSNTLRLLSPMWTNHMTQLRTSPKKGKPGDYGLYLMTCGLFTRETLKITSSCWSGI